MDGQLPAPSVVVVARNVANSMTKKLRRLEITSIREHSPTICKVPNDIRAKNQEAYVPKFTAIGPYHRGNNEKMENIKFLYLHDLLARDEIHNKLEVYAHKIAEREPVARRQYSEPFHDLFSEDFVEMLVLDGCFIVEFFLKRAVGEGGKPLMSTLRNDLLLLENQIPFFILQVILDNSTYELPVSNDVDLVDLGLHYLTKGKVSKNMLPIGGTSCPNAVYHLLHLSHLCLLQSINKPASQETMKPPDTLEAYVLDELKSMGSMVFRVLLRLKNGFQTCLSTAFIFLLKITVTLVELLVKWKLPSWWASSRRTNTSKKVPRTIPTAMELLEAGVEFKKKEKGDSYIVSLDVSFKLGTMTIPQVQIQETSNSVFRNMLAFEQTCPDVGNQFTSYVVFMDNLIDTAADVALLKRLGIVESKLGCDKDVADFFNGLRSGLYFHFNKHYLKDLFKEVNDYKNVEYNQWRATLMHNYLNSPWAIISLIGAFILLGLAAVQTAFAIIQV